MANSYTVRAYQVFLYLSKEEVISMRIIFNGTLSIPILFEKTHTCIVKLRNPILCALRECHTSLQSQKQYSYSSPRVWVRITILLPPSEGGMYHTTPLALVDYTLMPCSFLLIIMYRLVQNIKIKLKPSLQNI